MTTSLPGRTAQARARASALVLCLALFASCSLSGRGDTESTTDGGPGATASHVGATTPTAELRTTTALGRLVGRLPGPRRIAVRKQVTTVIDRWWEAAYLSTDSSAGADVAAAFPGFTEGARVRAKADRELMTNSRLEAAAITPLMRKVHLDLLAVNKRVRSVTARFDLRLRVTGTEADAGAKRLQLRGRLFLTRGPGGWKVFGYDVSKGWL
ncbi:MAG: hypothetical protein JWN68_3032 [Nocardioides sp.]|jgi:hypothetical protein|uniref:hypothetical protein n=1 Tax=Nocardioides sp. TaxID=35761 RepID=UPI0026137326|nr:hypothetical protein [Nocardioides sp.]MCW2835079.1 hypothetical protein [Nocardioides sp.]